MMTPTYKELGSIRTSTLRHIYQYGGASLIEAALLNDGVTFDEMYDILMDDHVSFVFGRLVSEFTTLPYEILPASDSDRDRYIAEFVTDELSAFGYQPNASLPGNDGFGTLQRGLATSYIMGISVAEILWKRSNGRIRLKDIKLRDVRRFKIGLNGDDYNLRLLSQGDMMIGEEVPPCKFIVNRWWVIPNEDPYGLGYGRFLIHPVEWRRQTLTYWLSWIDKFIDPMAIGTYDENANEQEIVVFRNAVRSIAKEMAATFPKTFNIDFVQAPLGAPDILSKLIEKCESIVSLILTGEETTGKDGGGPQIRDVESSSIRSMLAESLNNSIFETLNGTLIHWLVDYNFDVEKYPKIVRKFPEKKDPIKLAELLTALYGLGWAVDDEAWMADQFGMPLKKMEGM